MRAAPTLGLAALVALAACFPPPSLDPAPVVDSDGDGSLDAYDCAPRDPSRWHVQQLFVDADGDGHGGPGASVATCRGTSLPAGFAESVSDCDDADPAAHDLWMGYRDSDGDGFGSGPWIQICAGYVPPFPLSQTADDCAPDDPARWRELPYLYVDTDRDGWTVPREGVVCSGVALPQGYATVASGVDCDDSNAAASLTVTGYADGDRDGAGAGSPQTFCTAGGLPDGFAASASDCAPEDPSRRDELAYAYRDADLDRRTVPQQGTLCVFGALPDGYLTTATGNDCDDANRDVWELRSGVPDTDRDGHGAGDVVQICSGAALPVGFVAPGGEPDCAPDDPDAWGRWSYAYRDQDGDTYTVPSSGTLCVGTAAPAGYATTANGNDCDDANALVWQSVVGYEDPDHDTVGSGPAVTSCTSGALPDGQVASGADCAPDDGTRWQLLSYSLADLDGDGYTAPVATGKVCSGAALPDPYRAVAVGRDCDDANSAVWRAIVRYLDQDGDGVGATPRTIFCVAEDEPVGHSRFGWDLDDHDPAVQWDGSDADLIVELL